MTLRNESTVVPQPDKSVVVCTSARRRRERHDIIVEILEMSKNEARRTKMMEKIGMSFSQINIYLNELKEAGFISEDSGNWKTTRKGRSMIEACKICYALVNRPIDGPRKTRKS